jgi:nucleotide-binding universal stress UspA family protein
MFKKILVPLDGTPTAAVAVSLALRLARLASAELVLVRVVSANGSKAAAGQTYLDGVASDLPPDGPRAETLVRTGSPGEAIVAAVQDQQADLVVMATHGRSGLARATAGSVTEHVLTHSAAPVLTLRQGTESRAAMTKLLVPVDGTPGGTVALDVAVGLARTTGASIVLLQVTEPIHLSILDLPFGTLASAMEPSWEEEDRAAAQHYVDGLVARLQRIGVTAVGRSLIGSPAGTISQVARESEVDMIVMSTHALTGPVRTLLGSVADEVVRTSNRPVLLVRIPRQRASYVE